MPDDPFELNEQFQDIDPSVMDAQHWREVFAIPMNYPEHITLLEGRGVIAALRHKLRAKS